MTQPSERLIIAAFIPHASHPELAIRDRNGNIPATLHELGHETHEGAFYRLGRLVTGLTLGVDRLLYNGSSEPGILTYLAKPIDIELASESDYTWYVSPRQSTD